MNKHLIVGMGEVGSAIYKILSDRHLVFGLDRKTKLEEKNFDFIHVCIPYQGSKFVSTVKNYVAKYGAKRCIVINHSSVPVGITDKLGERAVHSPVRGVHPHLEKGIRTFVKYFGGKQASFAAKQFEQCDLKTYCVPSSRDTEALKLMDTTQYGYMILVEKMVKEFCDKNRVSFDFVYADANNSYNDGYDKLGMGHVKRPVLKHMDGPIGGHCVRENARIAGGNLAKFFREIHKAMFGKD